MCARPRGILSPDVFVIPVRFVTGDLCSAGPTRLADNGMNAANEAGTT
jgi:hypothetical protein